MRGSVQATLAESGNCTRTETMLRNPVLPYCDIGQVKIAVITMLCAVLNIVHR